MAAPKRKEKKRRKRRSKLGDDVTILNIKLSSEDKRALKNAAKKYTKGNLSEWLRKAGIFFKPF